MDIVLYRPEIPPNTGNIARLAVCTGCPLHIVGKAAFSMDEAAVKRAGLDYWDQLQLHQHASFEVFASWATEQKRRVLAVTKFGDTRFSDVEFRHDDTILFGSETSGLPPEVHDWISSQGDGQLLKIPMGQTCRSLNLSNAVSIVIYEALRQLEYPHLG
ncbi:MAG: tRNA (cytidine(34)-2'-O)-methyltransferase [Leptospirales bacterium]|nr:tRNA (cytidine(34)-2'-O)-methyltransferase [Leptospirales bacterium]